MAIRPMNNIKSVTNHRRSIRLPRYDYTQPGDYFITICAASRQFIFGEITAKESRLSASPIGELVIDSWESIPLHFPSVILDEYVLMPNHLHGDTKNHRMPRDRHKGSRDDDEGGGLRKTSTPVYSHNHPFLQIDRFPPGYRLRSRNWPTGLAAKLLRTRRSKRARLGRNPEIHLRKPSQVVGGSGKSGGGESRFTTVGGL